MRGSSLRRFMGVLAGLACAVPAALAFDLQGHRGARGLAPENTLPGFAKALSVGVHTLELDVGLTRDGVLVVSHDPSLNPDITRGPDGAFLAARGPLIWASTLQELQRHDVGRINPASRYAQTFAAQQPVDGTRIPRLADVFALAARAGARDLRFNIETKIDPRQPEATAEPEPFARALVAAIREAGLTRRATIQSFDWRTLQVVQREAPEIDTVYLSAQQRWLDNIGAGTGTGAGATAGPTGAAASPVSWTAGLRFADHGSVPKMVKAAGGKTWSPHFGDLTPALREEARALGLAVVVWTVNDPAAIARMLDLKVDGIISDRPDLVREEMARRGMALPRAWPVSP